LVSSSLWDLPRESVVFRESATRVKRTILVSIVLSEIAPLDASWFEMADSLFTLPNSLILVNELQNTGDERPFFSWRFCSRAALFARSCCSLICYCVVISNALAINSCVAYWVICPHRVQQTAQNGYLRTRPPVLYPRNISPLP
jgi:hypothetical protein